MWVLFKLLTSPVRLVRLTGVFGSCLVTAFFLGFNNSAIAQQPLLEQKELTNTARVVEVAKEVPDNKNRSTAESFYQDGLKSIKEKRWGPAAKSFGASALYYPTPKALIGMAEAMAHLATTNDKAVKLHRLQGISSYLASSAALDEIQEQLTPSETDQLQRDRECISAFLATQKRQADCRLVNIAFGN